MLQEHFGLTRLPFAKDLAAHDLLATDEVVELSARLEHMRRHRGLFLLIGAPGTGKTAALRRWLDGLSDCNHKIVYQPLSTISVYDLYQGLNEAFGGDPAHRKAKLFANLQKAIQDWIDGSRRLPILVFDDAHLLPSSTLIELPMLLNFKMDSFDPMVVILAGHERLAARLRSPSLRHLDQRITLRFELPALDQDAVATYLDHHLRLAGAADDLIAPSARNALASTSRGIKRVLNRIALDSLTLVALDKRTTVTDEDVYNAAKSI